MALATIKKPQKWLFPSTASKEYKRILIGMVRQWKDEANKIIIPQLPLIIAEANRDKNSIGTNIISDSIDHHDGWTDSVKSAVKKFSDKIASIVPTKKTIRDVANKVNIFNNKQWKKIIKGSLGVDYSNREKWNQENTKAFIEENFALIEKLKGDTIQDINNTILRGVKEGKKHEDIKRDLIVAASVFAAIRNRAKLIATDQVNKFNGQLQQLRQTDFGVTKYIWETARDDRVRRKHENMESRICVWHNSTVYIGLDNKQHSRSGINGVEAHPGEPINCRCSASPDFSSVKDLDLII